LQERVEKLEGAAKTETEKLTERVTKAEQTLGEKDARIRTMQVRILAPQAGIQDPKAAEDAASLLDWSAVKDPEKEDSIIDALKDLVKDRPYLIGNIGGRSDGGEGGGSRSTETSDMNRSIREMAGRTVS
jgi:hypothetical protein